MKASVCPISLLKPNSMPNAKLGPGTRPASANWDGDFCTKTPDKILRT